jgi:hypothetical protein
VEFEEGGAEERFAESAPAPWCSNAERFDPTEIRFTRVLGHGENEACQLGAVPGEQPE